MSGLGRRIARPVTEILDEVADLVPRGMGQGQHRTGDRTRRAADEFDATEDRIRGQVPVYTVDEKGNVRELLPNGQERPVRQNDSSGIQNLLGTNGRATPKVRGQHNLPRQPANKRPRVNSTRVRGGSTDLARATQRVRLARGDRGAGNYAAFHYRSGGDEFILVGRSVPRTTTHSEQVIGVPFVARNMQGGVVGAYTERGPCHNRSPTCDAWLAHYFPGTPVTHSFDFGPTTKDEEIGNRRHAAYVQRLFANGLGAP